MGGLVYLGVMAISGRTRFACAWAHAHPFGAHWVRSNSLRELVEPGGESNPHARQTKTTGATPAGFCLPEREGDEVNRDKVLAPSVATTHIAHGTVLSIDSINWNPSHRNFVALHEKVGLVLMKRWAHTRTRLL